MFLLLHRVKYRKKVPLGTGTEFQVPIPVLVPVQMWTVPNPNHGQYRRRFICDSERELRSLLVNYGSVY